MNTLKDYIKAIQEAVKAGQTIPVSFSKKGLSVGYVQKRVSILKNKSNKSKEDIEFLDVYGQYIEWYRKSSKSKEQPNNNSYTKEKPIDYDQLSDEEKEEYAYDAYADEKYEERSKGSRLRENENDLVIDQTTGKPFVHPVTGKTMAKITRYYYEVYVRDEQPLTGFLSREEMLLVYRLYSSLDGAGLTQRVVSRHFPLLTFRDFKRILRAFNITKQSIPIAPHILEETSEERAIELIFRNKENNILRKLETDRGKNVERILMETQRELVEIKKNRQDMKEMFSGLVLPEIKPFKIEKKELKKERAFIVFLADQHCGAFTEDDSLYPNKYDAKEFANRMEKVVEKIHENFKIYGRFDKLIVCAMGDSLDGYNEMTTRGGHTLPQNLNNKQQFTTYIETTMKFFETLHKMNVANAIEFYCCGDSNHSGDWDFCIHKALSYVFHEKYPDMIVRVFDKFIEHFEYGDHTYILTHGKDKEDMKFGLPLVLTEKVQNYFNEYIIIHGIKTNTCNLIKADLHQSLTQFGKRFRYRNVLSMYGASKWIFTNFGHTLPGTDFEVVEKNGKNYGAIIEGRIYF